MTRRSAPTPESAAPLSVLADAQRLVAELPDRLPVKIPWWGAILLAVTFTAVGFAYDAGAGNGELGAVFATFYVLGCLLAVLLVQRAGLFTAMIQPPLILFVAVPTVLLPVPQLPDRRAQGHPDQLRLSADRAFPADVLHRRRGRCSHSVLVRWYLLRGVEDTGDSADDAEAPVACSAPHGPPLRPHRRRGRRDRGAAAARRPRREAAEPTSGRAGPRAPMRRHGPGTTVRRSPISPPRLPRPIAVSGPPPATAPAVRVGHGEPPVDPDPAVPPLPPAIPREPRRTPPSPRVPTTAPTAPRSRHRTPTSGRAAVRGQRAMSRASGAAPPRRRPLSGSVRRTPPSPGTGPQPPSGLPGALPQLRGRSAQPATDATRSSGTATTEPTTRHGERAGTPRPRRPRASNSRRR